MKKITAVICISVYIFTLCSCGKIEIVELNERLIIEAIGIDFEDGLYRVTIEGLDSFSAGSENSSISAPSLTKCYMFQGETIGMAMNSISVVTGQIPLFSQARILLVGLESAKTRLSEILDFFRREYTTRTDILFAVTEGAAADTVSADFGKNVSAGNVLEAAVSSGRFTGRSCLTPLYQFLNSVMGESDNAFCPVIGTKENSFTEQKEVKLSGTAVFGKDGAVKILSPESTLGMLIISDGIDNGDFTVNTSAGTATLEIIECKTKTKVLLKDGRVHYRITTKLSCDIPEFQSDDFRGLTKTDTEKLSEEAAKTVTEIMCDALKKTVYEENFDVFHIGRAVNLKNHSFYNEFFIKNGMLSEFTVCEIKTELSIRRIGKIILEEENKA
ncbi:MAG: hypothetical protein IKB08_02210 [Clostridia bacterium]|nr:hypothetical protein [Clostridia bacterium]